MSWRHPWTGRGLLLVLGLMIGWAGGRFWPETPIHAVATDGGENFAIATGPVDENTEAFFFLDFLTGQLRGAVVSNQTRDFQTLYNANVLQDLTSVIQMKNTQIRAANAGRRNTAVQPTPEIQLPKTPHYVMVTGYADLRRGAAGSVRPGRSVVYVAETNTGIVLAYAVPWSPENHAANRPFAQPLTLWAADQFSSVVLRPE
ncbi:MAG: hypothetical protein D6741_01295 [Planctomycetota bacterium]|nr:MAG: hypothetical protein D6741_01295 [Planctomycetota bacterium]